MNPQIQMFHTYRKMSQEGKRQGGFITVSHVFLPTVLYCTSRNGHYSCLTAKQGYYNNDIYPKSEMISQLTGN